MEELTGKTAVITGAASGIGLGMSKRLAQAGMNIVLADIEEPALADATAEIQALGVQAMPMVVDVTDADAVETLAEASVAEFGAVHVVANNAGVGGSMGGDPSTPIDLKDFRWVMEVNLMGVVHGHASFLPRMMAQGEGHIVNTASMAGHFPGHSAYSASKWAVVALTEGLWNTLTPMDTAVSCSCLCPGWVNTRIAESDRNRPEWAAGNPLEETEPDELAELRRAFIEDALANGMSPDEVGGLVHDAIVQNKLWVFTDMTMVNALKPRYDAVLENRNPTFDIGGALGLSADG